MVLFWGVKGVFDITGKIVEKYSGMKNRVIFMGSPGFAVPCLEALIRSCYQVVAVYTQPDKQAGRGRVVASPPIKELAASRGLQVHQPDSLKDAAVADQIAALASDLIVVAAYGEIIPERILVTPRFGCINVHPSLLPQYRGPSPVATAILRGDKVTGATIILLDSGVDSGPVLSQKELPVSDEDTTGSLTARLAQLGSQLLVETLPLWVEGRLKPQPQDESQASYTRAMTKGDGEIDWRLPALELWRRVRAFDPWPGCYTWWQNRRLKISQVVPLPAGGSVQAGKVIALPQPSPAAVGVESGDGVLGLLRVQLEGKREVSAEEFVRGQRSFIGSLLS